MKHIIYKTVNKLNNKYYIGVHSTTNINDSYLGCGHWRGRKIYNTISSPILKAFLKYGDENFEREVLFIFENRTDALNKERELIDIKDKMCYNARSGGDTNYTYTQNSKLKMSEKAKIRSKKILLQTNLLKEHTQSRVGKTYDEIYGADKAKEVLHKKSLSATGRKHKEESKLKMSEYRKGRDSGKCKGRKKVYDVTTNKIIRLFPEDIDTHMANGIIINETKIVSKFHKVNYIKIK